MAVRLRQPLTAFAASAFAEATADRSAGQVGGVAGRGHVRDHAIEYRRDVATRPVIRHAELTRLSPGPADVGVRTAPIHLNITNGDVPNVWRYRTCGARVCPDATMPVILAIEKDRQQITQLTSIVRELGAELVLAESAERALAALGHRVPDLIDSPTSVAERRHCSDHSITRARHRRPARADALDSDTGNLGCAIARQAVTAAQRQRGFGRLRSGGLPRTACGVPRTRRRGEETVGRIVQHQQATTRAIREADAAGRGSEEAAEARAMEERRAADEARTAIELRIVEEQRAVKAVAEANAAEERRAAAEAAIAAAETRVANQQRAFEQAAQAATNARIAEEQRAARAAAEATKAEERRGAAEAAASRRRPKPPASSVPPSKPRWLPTRRESQEQRAARAVAEAQRRRNAGARLRTRRRPKPPVSNVPPSRPRWLPIRRESPKSSATRRQPLKQRGRGTPCRCGSGDGRGGGQSRQSATGRRASRAGCQ